MTGKNETIGLNVEQVQNAVKGIKTNAMQVTVDSVDWYQEKVFEILCKGWVTTTGKENITKSVILMNEVVEKVRTTAINIVDSIEDSATKIGKGLDTDYAKVGSSDLVLKLFNSDNAKDNLNGTKFVVVEYLKEAQEKLNRFIENRILKNFQEMLTCAEDCGLYDKDGELRTKVVNLLTEMKDSCEAKIEEINNMIQYSIDYQSEEANAAKALGQAALDISGALK